MTVMTWLRVNIHSINLHGKSISPICVATEKFNSNEHKENLQQLYERCEFLSTVARAVSF